MHCTYPEFLELIKTQPIKSIVRKHILDGIPYLYRNDYSQYFHLKEILSEKLGVHTQDLAIVGSARTGFSLNPYHIGRAFSDKSDVDIVVVSDKLFDMGWMDLLNLQDVWYALTKSEQEKVSDHMDKIYWGNIMPGWLPPRAKIAKIWQESFGGMSKLTEFSRREINGRLFRSWWHAEMYYCKAIGKLKTDNIEI